MGRNYCYAGEWRLDVEIQKMKDVSVDNVRRQFADSPGFLSNRLRLYRIHSATIAGGFLEDESVAERVITTPCSPVKRRIAAQRSMTRARTRRA